MWTSRSRKNTAGPATESTCPAMTAGPTAPGRIPSPLPDRRTSRPRPNAVGDCERAVLLQTEMFQRAVDMPTRATVTRTGIRRVVPVSPWDRWAPAGSRSRSAATTAYDDGRRRGRTSTPPSDVVGLRSARPSALTNVHQTAATVDPDEHTHAITPWPLRPRRRPGRTARRPVPRCPGARLRPGPRDVRVDSAVDRLRERRLSAAATVRATQRQAQHRPGRRLSSADASRQARRSPD